MTETTAPTDSQPEAKETESRPKKSIVAKGLVKAYGSKTVVKGIDLEVNTGEVVGLLGPNGAGKTTTFYMIAGLVEATKGSVILNGKDVAYLKIHRRARLGIGYLAQEPSVFKKLTVWQNVQAVAETIPFTRKERKDVIERQLNDLGLLSLAKQKAYTLSGGERRRLEIARCLVTQPDFLLMDEPFAGVDPINVSEVQRIVLGLKDRGIGILITDHNVRDTLSITDRAYIVNKGEILASGDRHFLVNDPQSRQIYLGENFNM
ncbi:LPS export ABC transporter ATP-binding protein [Pelagicoccus sp. NFK12]|uniref:LPS export ABC transporter ATP-binding protein n=1 Tax=Pelagicoccus enzymogenes TaxID=2773457 RepID=A0A927IFU4_9BACT|nr:LPS export ABC transporter ATP-binding protein [Pelagicoccus enzymogenes]MBD5778018.1 LPS export ABC transporter ATP-binding protein [Pelagicoccus enzymogenes]MDQ8197926.1 LPS export ABC transporter ATP-binding protein [Pelagicoccus enzymogenes]